MRKWMRELLQRRKKKPAEASDQPAPPPLQPAYFDAEQQPESSGGSAHVEAERLEPAPSATDAAPSQSAHTQSEEEPLEAQPATSQQALRGSNQSGRGRRRRGGRGRGGRGREQAVAQAFTPAAVKGSIPGIPVDAAEVDAQDDLAEGGEIEAPGPPPPVAVSVPKVPGAAPAAVQRAPKGIVVLAIGLPGS